MFLKSFVLIIVTIVSLFASDKSFSYYTDGVYDTYSEIENSLRSGLKEEALEDIQSKWLVVQDISSDSTVQIIFYRTIAHKNNFFNSVIAKNNSNNKNYMVYGKYARKADAEFALNRLKEKGLNPFIVFSGKDNSYTTNPIVVKKFIKDMKNLLRNTPVLLIKTTETIESSKCEKQKVKTVYIEKKVQEKQCSFDSKVYSDFKLFKEQWRLRGKINFKNKTIVYKERSGHTNTFGIKDLFKGYKITEIYFAKRTGFYVAKLLASNGKTYKLYTKKTSSNKYKEKKKKKKQYRDKKAKAKAQSDSNSFALCDFTKISNVKLPNGNRVDIKDTYYAGQTLKVKHSISGKEHKLKYGSYSPILVSQHYYNIGCAKNEK